MANNYESLKTDGHYTLAYRIFLKMRNWVQTDVPANAVFTDTLPMAYCDTNADTTAKVAKCTNFSLKNNSFISINFKNGNTVTRGTGVTLNINNTGAKPVYVDFINDNSIPIDTPFDAGTYILYYTNQAYYLYTNGVLYPYRDVAKQDDLRYYSFGSQDGSVTILEGSSTSGGATTYTENFLVQKVNGHTVNSDVPSNAVFTDTTYTAGDNVNISQQNVISADQIDDSYDYDDYEDLPDSIKMQDKIFMVSNAPIQKFAEYDQATKTVSFNNGFASYNETTKTVRIGG